MKDLLHMPHLSAAEAAADDRLDSLGHAGEDGDPDQRQIRDDSIGRHPHIARQGQENLIKEKHDDPGGNLCNQGGNPQGKDSPGLFAVQRAPDRPEAVFSAEKVGGGDEDSDAGSHAGSQGRAEHPHAQRENKDVIQHHVAQAAHQHGGHGKVRLSVVADKADQQVVK